MKNALMTPALAEWQGILLLSIRTLVIQKQFATPCWVKMHAISRARVCDCVSDVFIQAHFVRPSLRRRENIKVRGRGSLFTRRSCLEIRERRGSVLSYFVRVCVRGHGRVLGGIDTAGLQDPD